MGATRLKRNQTKHAAEVLSRAFYNDPLMIYLIPDNKERKRKLPKLILKVVRYCRSFHTVETDDNFNGVACWLPPGSTGLKYGKKIMSGSLAVPFLLGFRGYKRFLKVMRVLDQLEAKHVPEPHWYLFMIGVDTGARGKGTGSKLIEAKFKEAEREGSQAAYYLETMNDKTLPLYKKLGFRVCETVTVENGESHPLKIWAMKKD
ncbi:GNAT family N-acetyltransferase [Salipaludibacillus sp. CUR1]|uniref:GNAT family N-acetyltransferase n=1 Tax=Salipaludibacillus sp. CUR1 TaxID=2820003 RepID=UPI001E37FC40|nr:GNAT family N-acetyltransferase [Salipaludibacillus sp. CUR1]MCE7794461.1 GNAT family N-acetyltransferase [Salipaludibacillus sp. CUR1]